MLYIQFWCWLVGLAHDQCSHLITFQQDALDYHILVTLLCKVSCRVAAMWVQGSSDVTTS